MHQEHIDFQKDVIEASHEHPIVVDFWAEWCGPCKMLGPVLEKLDAEADGKWKLVKVDTEQHQDISAEYKIRGIPAVKMFSGGEVVAEFVGALPEVQVRRWLDENLPTESRKLLLEAQTALENGDSQKATTLFTQIVASEPDNYDARIPLARLLLDNNPEKARDLVAQAPAEHPQFNVAEGIRTLARLTLDFKTIDGNSGSAAWQDYLEGIRALQKQDYDTALRHWLDALIVDKTLDNDGPRKACVAAFNVLGQQHELTRKHHRAFTSALF